MNEKKTNQLTVSSTHKERVQMETNVTTRKLQTRFCRR